MSFQNETETRLLHAASVESVTVCDTHIRLPLYASCHSGITLVDLVSRKDETMEYARLLDRMHFGA